MFLFFFLLLFLTIIIVTRGNNSTHIYLHIGPMKTGTTHIQTALDIMKDELYNNGYLFELILWDESDRVKVFVEHVKQLIRKAIDNNLNLIISAEILFKYEETKYDQLYEVLRNFNTTIIFTYRECKNWVISAIQERERNLVKVFNTLSKELDFNMKHHYLYTALDRYATAFGSDNMVILDYYGIQAANKDILDVFTCEILGILCEYEPLAESELLNNSPVKDNVMIDHLKFYPLMRQIVHRVMAAGCDFSNFNWKVAANKVLADISRDITTQNKILPRSDIPLETLTVFCQQETADIIDMVEKNNIKYLYRNDSANYEKSQSKQYWEEVDVLTMLKNNDSYYKHIVVDYSQKILNNQYPPIQCQ